MDFILAIRESIIGIFEPYFGAVKFFSALFSLGLLAAIIYTTVQLTKILLPGKRIQEAMGAPEKITRKRTVRAWQEIEKRLAAGDESNLKLAIIEADKILDDILKLSGLRGDTMADRLKQMTSAQISNLEDIWVVHKIRNRIVHEPDYNISKSEAEQALRIFGRAFQELGLID